MESWHAQPTELVARMKDSLICVRAESHFVNNCRQEYSFDSSAFDSCESCAVEDVF